MKTALFHSLLILICCILTDALCAQTNAADNIGSKHSLSIGYGVLPSTFLGDKLKSSQVRFWSNKWRERYRLATLAYERRLNTTYPAISLRTELSYYGFKITDYRPEGAASVAFHQWEGAVLMFSPSVMASFWEEAHFQPNFGFGLLLNIPIYDELALWYSDEEQANFGFPRQEVQADGIAVGFGFYLQAGARIPLNDRWQLGFNGKGVLLEQRTGYSERTGIYYPVSRLVNRSIFSKTQFWGSLELIYQLGR